MILKILSDDEPRSGWSFLYQVKFIESSIYWMVMGKRISDANPMSIDLVG